MSLSNHYKMVEIWKNCHDDFVKGHNLRILPGSIGCSVRETEIQRLVQCHYFSGVSREIDRAWSEYYSDTYQNQIMIVYRLYERDKTLPVLTPFGRRGKINPQHSPLIMIGKLKELIKEDAGINDINHIHMYDQGWENHGGKELCDDSKSLHKYGYCGIARILVKLWDPKIPGNEEPEPAPSPASVPVERVASSVIQATPLSESDNGEINRLKARVAELEERLKEIEHKLG